MNIQGWFSLVLTSLISLQSKGLSKVFCSTTVQKHQFFHAQHSFMVQLSRPYVTTGKTVALTIWTFAGKVISLLFNVLSRFVINFLPKKEKTSWLQSPSTVILEPRKIKSVLFPFPRPPRRISLPWGMGPEPILVFWMLNFKPAFSLSFFTFIKRLFSSSLLSAIRVVSSAYLRPLPTAFYLLLYFLLLLVFILFLCYNHIQVLGIL